MTFLELFYDLVYVALIAQLAHALASDMSWASFGHFCFLFLAVWWAWSNGTSYHDVHGNNDIRTRVFTFLQMFTVVAMAVFAHDALGTGSMGFSLSYGAFQLILTFLWWRTGVHDPAHSVLSRPYSLSFLISTLTFFAAAFVPVPYRFYMWGGGLGLSILFSSAQFVLGRRNPAAWEQMEQASVVSPSLVERVGLLTIIVLGEVIIGVVNGLVGSHHLKWQIAGLGALGVLIGIGLWWLYFDLISHHLPIQKMEIIWTWHLLHLPVLVGMTTVGALVVYTIEHASAHMPDQARWILVLSLAVTMVAITALSRTIQILPEHQAISAVARRVMLASSVLVIIPGWISLDAIWLLVIGAMLLLAPVVSALRFWIARAIVDDTLADSVI